MVAFEQLPYHPVNTPPPPPSLNIEYTKICLNLTVPSFSDRPNNNSGTTVDPSVSGVGGSGSGVSGVSPPSGESGEQPQPSLSDHVHVTHPPSGSIATDTLATPSPPLPSARVSVSVSAASSKGMTPATANNTNNKGTIKTGLTSALGEGDGLASHGHFIPTSPLNTRLNSTFVNNSPYNPYHQITLAIHPI